MQRLGQTAALPNGFVRQRNYSMENERLIHAIGDLLFLTSACLAEAIQRIHGWKRSANQTPASKPQRGFVT